MTIEHFEPNANDFPLGSYEDAADAFVKFAVTKRSPIHGSQSENNIYFIGTYWDDPGPSTPADLRNAKNTIDIPAGKPILINPIIAVISKTEHPDQFEEDDPPDEEVMKKTEEVMDKANATVLIKDNNGGQERRFEGKELRRVKPKERKKEHLRVNPGCCPTMLEGAEIDACWDGYFIALKGLKEGSYRLDIEADSPLFGAKKSGDRFYSECSYNINVA